MLNQAVTMSLRKCCVKCFFLLFYFASVSCQQNKAEVSKHKTKPVVQVVEIKEVDSSDVLLYPGQVFSELSAVVKAPSAGRIIKSFFRIGDQIKQGAILFEIRNTDTGFDYSKVIVRSPVQGTLLKLDANVGHEISAGATLASLIDPEKLEVRIEVPAADVASITEKHQSFLVNEGSSESIALEKAFVSPAVDMKTGTVTMGFKLNQSKLVPGQLVMVRIASPTRKTVLVESNAIVYREGQESLRVIDKNNIVRIQKVTLGKRNGTKIEIQNGVTNGDIVVVESSKSLHNGDEVEILKIDNKNAKDVQSVAR